MAILSTGLVNAMLGSSSLKSALANGFINIYASLSADIPATADAAIDGAKHTLIMTVYGDGVSAGLNLGTADSGVIGKAAGETWTGPVLATANAAFFRHVGSADTGAVSATEPRIQGIPGLVNSDLNVGSLAYVSGTTREVKSVSIALPKSR